MKLSSTTLLMFISVLLVLVFKLAFTDAAAVIFEDSMIENSASDENDAALRNKKDINVPRTQRIIPSPQRRYHLKFGALGKRHAYGFLGKRNDAPQIDLSYDEWLNDIRERRAGRPQYGILG